MNANPFHGKRVAFVGKLGGVNRREAVKLARKLGATPVEGDLAKVDVIVVGADEQGDLGSKEIDTLPDAVRQAIDRGEVELLSETEWWQRLGLVENEASVRRLYTPAMLASLIGSPVSTIRAWHRHGLLGTVVEVHRLPYFAFEEIATAKRLRELSANGASLETIRRRLAELAEVRPDVERPLAALDVVIEGKKVLLREGESLVEPGGQKRFDFQESPNEDDSVPAVLSMQDASDAGMTPEELEAVAAECDAQGNLSAAADAYRASLAAGGPKADTCLALADVLYRQGDLPAARERLFMAIELDEEFVEARANLGCLLAEMGQRELAVAALEGALRWHTDYADAHYHLARLLDEAGRASEAQAHWQTFLNLAAESPWADEARERLSV
jgi:tetratricopeptide (TPR) repeat protein